MNRRDEPLVKIASAANGALAAMWREVLENNGIACLVRMTGPEAYVTFVSPHEIYARAADAERARELLAAYNEDESDLALGRGDGDGDDEDEDDEDAYWMEGAGTEGGETAGAGESRRGRTDPERPDPGERARG